MALQLYTDEKGKLIKAKLEKDELVIHWTVVQLFLDGASISFVQQNRLYVDLLSVSFIVYPTSEHLVYANIAELWLYAPNMERLSIVLHKECNLVIRRLNVCLTRMPYSKVKDFRLVVNNSLFEPDPWYIHLETLSMDNCNIDIARMPNLTSVSLAGTQYCNFLFFERLASLQILTFTSTSFSFHNTRDWICNWLHYFTAPERRTAWLFANLDWFTYYDNREKEAREYPKDMGKWIGYGILRQRFKNMLIMNRHVHRMHILHVLEAVATRVSPYMGSSVVQIARKFILPHLRLFG